MSESGVISRRYQATEDTRTVQAVCAICNGGCGMDITFEGDAIVEIKGRKEHPATRGYLCQKGRNLKDIFEAPDRLVHPLIKTASGEWREISWDEALDIIAEKLSEVKAKHGAEAVAVHVGQAGVRKEFTPYVQRFCAAFGTPNFSTAGSHCHISKVIANELVYGALPVPDYTHTNSIVLWGYNPQISCPPQMFIINEALDRGAKLIVVDPKATPLARKADVHLQLRPGTDGALALGLLNVVISENLYNKAFVEKWTVGFDELTSLVGEYAPQRVEEITWIPTQKTQEAARLYATSSPACSYPGIAVELQTNGVQAARAIAILQAITGNLDIKGGAIFAPGAALSSLKLTNTCSTPAIGENRFPIFCEHNDNAQANIYADAILDKTPYPLRALIISGSNAVITWPNAKRLISALEDIEFLVVMDHFMTETAKLADLVLPAASFLARPEIWDHTSIYGALRIGLSPKVSEDKKRMTDWQFWTALARRMGYNDEFPWQSEEEALTYRLAPLGATVYELSDNENGHIYGEHKEKAYEKDGFRTPSGKVEIYSKELEKYGYDPLPVYREPHESPVSMPELAREYPLVLTTGKRMPSYHHSRYRNIASLLKLAPDPEVEVHPEKARELGINEGERVIVESLRGSAEFVVRLTDEIDSRVVFIPHGWEDANANMLTDNEILDPISGFPADRALLAKIRKKG
ncbi:MAG: molybdopterin-dependent oxidoreductase [Actinobacteria bacterium]|nr:molybdopterin-dependent oxidoreductase [Actinomycetota bacterium]